MTIAQALIIGSLAGVVSASAQAAAPTTDSHTSQPEPLIVSPPGTPRPPFQFNALDQQLLEEIQLGCWNYFKDEVDPATGMVRDRTGANVISVAGVGFQLTALAIADHRGWISTLEARSRALSILISLQSNPSNRVRGLFYHYLQPGTAGPSTEGYEEVVSTIDTALLFAGLITVSSHFGGTVAAIADQLIIEGDWSSFKLNNGGDPTIAGFISLGWEDPGAAPFEAGLLPFAWADAGDEQRLTAFMGMIAPNEGFAIPRRDYYRMRRTVGTLDDGRSVAWFPWSGALFTSFFSHCWINYAARGPDNPAAWGVADRPRVDWWENSRRTAQMHRAKAIANPLNLPGIGATAWGMSACDGQTGYIVPGLFPQLAAQQFGVPGFDHLTIQASDNWEDGTLAPYTAGSTIMFEPGPAVAALRHYRQLASQNPAMWENPAAGGYGFADSFRPGPNGQVAWVAPDRVAIDAGPMLIAIENARSGFVWNAFHAHRFVRAYDRVREIQAVPADATKLRPTSVRPTGPR